MTFLPQSSRVKAALLCFLAGAIYLVAAPQYAKLCQAAPSPLGQGNISAMEIAYGLPAILFAIMGVVALVFGTCMLINHIDDN